MNCLKDIRKILPGCKLVVDATSLVGFTHDETPGLVGETPLAAIYPTCHKDVVQIAKLCHQHRVSMIPRGGGTGKAGGCVPISKSIVVCFEKMDKIINLEPANLTMRVQPGMLLRDLKEHIAKENLMFPPDPASADASMIGGNVATNAGGPSAFKYGSTRDFVLGMQIVKSDGSELKLGKNTPKGVAGYDLTSLLVGSEGTLGLITEITLRLLPKPKAYATALIPFGSQLGAGKAVSEIVKAGLLPSSLEYIDETSILAVQKAGKGTMVPAGAKACLLIEFDGMSEEVVVEQMLGMDSRLLGKDRIGDDNGMDPIIATDAASRRKIWDMRHNLSEACKHYLGQKISEDICVPPSKIPEMIDRVQKLGAKYHLLTCAFGHSGDGNLHVQILFEKTEDAASMPDLLQELFEMTVELGGTITGEHGIGIAKMPYLSLEQSREIIDLQKSIQKIFDPAGLMNPGKLFPE